MGRGWGAAIAQWIHLRLPPCSPSLNPKHTIYTFSFIAKFVLYLYLHCEKE